MSQKSRKPKEEERESKSKEPKDREPKSKDLKSKENELKDREPKLRYPSEIVSRDDDEHKSEKLKEKKNEKPKEEGDKSEAERDEDYEIEEPFNTLYEIAESIERRSSTDGEYFLNSIYEIIWNPSIFDNIGQEVVPTKYKKKYDELKKYIRDVNTETF